MYVCTQENMCLYVVFMGGGSHLAEAGKPQLTYPVHAMANLIQYKAKHVFWQLGGRLQRTNKQIGGPMPEKHHSM